MSETEEKCPKCGELKSACKCTKDGVGSQSSTQEIKLKIDTDSMKDVMKRLTDEEKKSEDLAIKLQKEKEEKEALAKSLEEEKTIKEDYEGKLKIIGEKKVAEKQKIIMDKAKEVITDEAHLKQIEESIKNPENLKATEELVNTFYEVLKQGQKAHEEQTAKEKEEMEKKLKEKTGGKGNVAMTPEMIGKEKTGEDLTEGYEGDTASDAHRAMIADLRKKSHSKDPKEAAKAQSILSELVKKWAVAVKSNYDGKATGGLGEIGPKNIKEQPSLRDITKDGGEAV